MATKRSYLVKQGAVVKSWRKRWFSLEHGYLRYYAKEEDEGIRKPKGTIVLNAGYKVERWDDKQYGMQLRGAAGRTYLLVAASAAEREEWMEAFQKSIESFKSVDGGKHRSQTMQQEIERCLSVLNRCDTPSGVEACRSMYELLSGDNSTSATAELMSKSAVSRILQLLRTTTSTLLRCSAAQLLALLCKHSSLRELVREEGGPEVCRSMLEENDFLLRKIGCLFFASVTLHDGPRQAPVSICDYVTRNGIHILLANIVTDQDHEMQTVSWALACLGNVAISPASREAIVEVFREEHFSALLDVQDVPELHANVCHVLANLAASASPRKVLLGWTGVLQRLEQVFSKREAAVQRFALHVYSNLLLDDTACDALDLNAIAAGVHDILVQEGKLQAADQALLQAACITIVNGARFPLLAEVWVSRTLDSLTLMLLGLRSLSADLLVDCIRALYALAKSFKGKNALEALLARGAEQTLLNLPTTNTRVTRAAGELSKVLQEAKA